MSRFNLVVTIVFGVASIAIWAVFLRPVARVSNVGTIASKTFQEESTYWQSHDGAGRGFRTPTPITIAEAYVFEIEIEGESDVATHSINLVAGEQFSEGDQVTVEYERRGLPPFWRRVYVFGMEVIR